MSESRTFNMFECQIRMFNSMLYLKAQKWLDNKHPYLQQNIIQPLHTLKIHCSWLLSQSHQTIRLSKIRYFKHRLYLYHIFFGSYILLTLPQLLLKIIVTTGTAVNINNELIFAYLLSYLQKNKMSVPRPAI